MNDSEPTFEILILPQEPGAASKPGGPRGTGPEQEGAARSESAERHP